MIKTLFFFNIFQINQMHDATFQISLVIFKPSPADLTSTSPESQSRSISMTRASRLTVTSSSITFMATMKLSESEDREKENTCSVEKRLVEVNLCEALSWETAW